MTLTVQACLLCARAYPPLEIESLPGERCGEGMREDERMGFDGGCRGVWNAGGTRAGSLEWWEVKASTGSSKVQAVYMLLLKLTDVLVRQSSVIGKN